MTEEINGPGVVQGLCSLANERFQATRPVLILTNDNMVRHVADGWGRLEGLYRLSWANDRATVGELLGKTSIEKLCETVQLKYPRTSYLVDEKQHRSDKGLPEEYPVVVKPSHPLSGFKVKIVDSAAQLDQLVESYERDLPFLVQDYIPGGDCDLRFVALYRQKGRTVASFTGRKLLSHPPALGQTTAAEPVDDDRLVALTEVFFSQTGIDGPVSLEFKIDRSGTPWVIEPTVGRTDYWLDCCIANGINFTVLEYLDQAGKPLPCMRQGFRWLWLDAERDPKILLRVLRHVGAGGRNRKLPRFTFWKISDPVPFLVACRRLVVARLRRIHG